MRTLIELARPRTLPLALAVICCGNALAYTHGAWRFSVFLLSLLTALSLQISPTSPTTTATACAVPTATALPAPRAV